MAHLQALEELSESDLQKWLVESPLKKFAPSLHSHDIDGEALVELTSEDLKNHVGLKQRDAEYVFQQIQLERLRRMQEGERTSIVERHHFFIRDTRVKLEADLKPLLEERASSTANLKDYWLCILRRIPYLNKRISREDTTALSHLKDVTVKTEDHGGFKLVFEFEENPLFEETNLSVQYVWQHGTDTLKEINGSKVTWKGEFNPLVQALPGGKAKILKSFFWWFQMSGAISSFPATSLSGIDEFYEYALFLRSTVIPDSFNWYRASGKAKGIADSLGNDPSQSTEAKKAASDLEEVEKCITNVLRAHQTAMKKDADSHEKELQEFYAKRAAVTKQIPRFWGKVLQHHEDLYTRMSAKNDVPVLNALKDIYVFHTAEGFEMRFTFGPNAAFKTEFATKTYNFDALGNFKKTTGSKLQWTLPQAKHPFCKFFGFTVIASKCREIADDDGPASTTTADALEDLEIANTIADVLFPNPYPWFIRNPTHIDEDY